MRTLLILYRIAVLTWRYRVRLAFHTAWRPAMRQRDILGYPASDEEFVAFWSTVVILAAVGAALVLFGLPPGLRLALRIWEGLR